MSEVVDSSLRKITKGAAVFFAGSVVALVTSFFGKVIVARYLNPSEFGVLSLSLVVFFIFCTISMFGIPDAMTRQASYYLGKGEIEKTKAIVKLSAILLVFFSILASLIMFTVSDYLAKVFAVPDLSWTLKVFSVAVPFLALRNFIISTFRVKERVDIKAIFGDIIPNVTRVLMIITVVLLSLSFFCVIAAYTLSVIIAGTAALVYAFKNSDLLDLKVKINLKYIKILLIFSLPLLLQGILGFILTWTDTLMVGYFMKASDVGLYSSAQPVANLMCTVLASVDFLYFPIVSKLYAEGKLNEAGRTYAVITKWLTAVVMPAFLVMVLFPKAVLWILYGDKYIKAYEVLRILALGFFFHVALGPNGITLLAFGEIKEVTIASLGSAITNVVLNFLLIPHLGIEGAAIASAVSYILANLIVSFKLFTYRIHPFTKNYLKPVTLSFLIALLIYFFTRGVLLNWWMLIVTFVLFVVGYFVTLLLTRSFEKEDVMLLLAIEQRLGLNLGKIKKIIYKFM